MPGLWGQKWPGMLNNVHGGDGFPISAKPAVITRAVEGTP
jgi:hypothetical protein